MRDIDVRRELHKVEIAQILRDDPTSFVIDELGILQGDFRIDIAVVNGQLHGFEIKSAADTLERLPVQQEMFSRIFDTLTLVAAEKHIKKASEIVPDWWGCIAVATVNGELTFERVRQPQQNRFVDAKSIAQLLWKEEALQILIDRGFTGVRSKARQVLWGILADYVELADLRILVRQALKQREGWRVAPAPSLCGG
jgi:hypothetical protein